MNDLYAEHIIDLYKNPRNKRVMQDADVTQTGINPSCGDHVAVYVKFGPNGEDKKNDIGDGIVADASFEGQGCAISIAAASLVSEDIKGKSRTEILALNKKNVFELLGTELGPARLKCGLLALESFQSAISRASKKT